MLAPAMAHEIKKSQSSVDAPMPRFRRAPCRTREVVASVREWSKTAKLGLSSATITDGRNERRGRTGRVEGGSPTMRTGWTRTGGAGGGDSRGGGGGGSTGARSEKDGRLLRTGRCALTAGSSLKRSAIFAKGSAPGAPTTDPRSPIHRRISMIHAHRMTHVIPRNPFDSRSRWGLGWITWAGWRILGYTGYGVPTFSPTRPASMTAEV